MYLITIIVPVYNLEKYLRRCLESLVNQTYENIEIIIINDGSTDNSKMICDEYVSKYSNVYAVHKANGGLGNARNVGIDLAKGDYIGFVDADDWVEKDTYEYLINLIKLYNAEICAGKIILSNDERKRENYKIKVNVFEGEEKLEQYLKIGIENRSSQYSVCNKLYSSQLFKKIRFPENCIFEDAVTNFKLIEKANRFVISNKNVYHYFMDSVSITRNSFSEKDLYLLETGKQMINLSNELNYRNVYKLANLYYAKTFLSLIIKYIYYGVDDNVKDKNKIFAFLYKGLKSNFSLLLKSSILLSRKIILILVVLFPKIILKISDLYRNKGCKMK